MSIVSEIERIKANIANAYLACQDKGATMPSVLNSANLVDCIASITGSEPVSGRYVADGLQALFSGEDAYNGGAWVDRINGHKFTPTSTATAPSYVSDSKMYQATNFGGMLGNFDVPSNYTLEFVFRDLKNVTNYDATGATYGFGFLMGSTFDNYTNKNVCRITHLPSVQSFRCAIFNNTDVVGEQAEILKSDLADNGLDTITVIPGVGMFRNGVKIQDNTGTSTGGKIGLFTPYDGTNASYFRTKGKIHAVRMYNRQLTEEEVLSNYNEDVRIYGV